MRRRTRGFWGAACHIADAAFVDRCQLLRGPIFLTVSPRRIVSYCIASHRILSYGIAVCHIVSYCVILCSMVSYRIASLRVLSYRVISHHIVWYRIVSRRFVSHCIASHFIFLSHRMHCTVSYRVVSCHAQILGTHPNPFVCPSPCPVTHSPCTVPVCPAPAESTAAHKTEAWQDQALPPLRRSCPCNLPRPAACAREHRRHLTARFCPRQHRPEASRPERYICYSETVISLCPSSTATEESIRNIECSHWMLGTCNPEGAEGAQQPPTSTILNDPHGGRTK